MIWIVPQASHWPSAMGKLRSGACCSRRKNDATGWELWAPLRPLYDDGDYDELSARLRSLIADNSQYPMLAFNLACSESLSGRTTEAMDALRIAIEGSEKHRADAREDPDFDAIREEPSFMDLIGE